MAYTETDLGYTASAGIQYTGVTDTSADWGDVPEDSYFFDKETELVYYKNALDVVISIYEVGGGGGGEVNTASNVGTGLGTFKQKVLQDLQFRSLLEGKGISLNLSISDEEVEIAQEVGIVGIGDGTGFYTFYPSISSALAVAVSGQTIKLFANIVETSAVTISLKDGVDFDFNGFSYTLSSATNVNAFDDGIKGNIVSVNFRGGSIIRLNAVPTTTLNGVAFKLENTGNQISFDNNFLIINEGNVVLNCGQSDITGGIWFGGSSTYSTSALIDGGSFTNGIFNVTQPITNSCLMTFCLIYSTDIAIYNQIDGVIDNCKISSNEQNLNEGTIRNTSITSTKSAIKNVGNISFEGGMLYNCSITGRNGESIFVGDAVVVCETKSKVYNCTINASRGIAISLDDSELCNSSCTSYLGESFGVVDAFLGAYISNNSIDNKQNSGGRNAIRLRDNGVVVVGNQLRLANSSSFGVSTSGSPQNAYIISNSLDGGGFLIQTINITNLQLNTLDVFGNIKIG